MEYMTEERRRRLVHRPRLTRLLDDTSAKTILLIAPAGYGKTTLAEQWLAGRSHGRVQLTESLADFAAFSLSLAEAAETVCGGVAAEISASLRRFADPASNADAITAQFVRALAAWPEDAWIGLDDYHLVSEPAPDLLVERLVTSSPVNLLICSRARPRWASAKQLLYGEIYEVGKARLAMTEEEATEVLGQDLDAAAGGLVAVADGWPAVIGLAAAAGTMGPLDDALPETLYRYFAEELLQKISLAARRAFLVLALVPTISDGVVTAIAPAEVGGRELSDDGLRVGLLIERTNRTFEMNPLVRSFLERSSLDLDATYRDDLLVRAFDHYVATANWDDAFGLARVAHLPNLVPALVEAAIEAVLAAGRVQTLVAWSDFARAEGIVHPALDLADAEVAFRRGLHRKAEAFALEAARRLDEQAPLFARAKLRAGQAAYFNDRHSEALANFSAARAAGRSALVTREATWGLFITAIDLERDDAARFLEAYEDLPDRSVDDVVRLATGRLAYGHRRHGLVEAVENARAVTHLAERVTNPMIATSFFNGYAGSLMMTADYETAIDVATRGVAEAKASGLDFVIPHARLVMTQSELGLRNERKAARLIDKMAVDARRFDDPFFAANARTLRARLEIARGNPDEAIATTEMFDNRVGSRAAQGERFAVRGLAYVMLGDIASAAEAMGHARRATTTAATSVLVTLTSLLHPRLCEHIYRTGEDALRAVARSGHYDMVVLAYRAQPQLLSRLGNVMDGDAIVRLLGNAHDEEMGVNTGLLSERSDRLAATDLSPRERDVGRLLVQGSTNAEIAETLFISEVTVKVHVRHILAKLGVRNRAAAAVLIAERLRGL